MDVIKTNRLPEYDVVTNGGFAWNERAITLCDISDGIAKNTQEQEDEYKVLEWRSDEWHIGRVIRFIKNPTLITPISINNECFGNHISNLAVIDDGHHRFMAHVYLGNENIGVEYGGRLDVLEYLVGKTNELPDW